MVRVCVFGVFVGVAKQKFLWTENAVSLSIFYV